MSRISNKELAETLVEKHGLSKQDAEKFVAKMFEVLGKGLQTDKQVKVKGLGTFKVVSVASRKSVDVNTGEPIVIEGRDKISFTPDGSMRDAVNRPFSQFDTVVVNDGVDFSAIDKKYEDSEKEDSEEETELEQKVEATELIEEQKVEQPNVNDEEEKEQPVVVESQEKENPVEDEQEDLPQKEEKELEQEEQKESIVKQEESKEIAEKVENAEPQKTVVEVEQEEPKKAIVEQKEPEGLEEKKEDPEEEAAPEEENVQSAQHRTLKYVCIAASVIIVILAVSAFYLFNQLQLRDNRIENLEAQVLEKKNNKTATKKTTSFIPAKKTQNIESSGDDIVPSNNLEKKSSNGVENNLRRVQNKETEATGEKEKINTNYNKDVRIRTGAYNIVGIDHTVTARAGQSLQSISRSQLGPGMECYVEAVNDGKTEFKAGEKVNIPKLKLKKRIR